MLINSQRRIKMIANDSMIMWMDTSDQSVHETTIEELYSKFQIHEKSLFYESSIDMSRFNVKITDMYGWTEIIKIVKQNQLTATGIYIDENVCLVGTNDTFIPIYENDNHRVGFHGELIYDYTLKHLGMMNTGDRVLLRIPGSDKFEFVNIKVNDQMISKFGSKYHIITKSRFFNANGFHIFGDENIKVEEVEKMYK